MKNYDVVIIGGSAAGATAAVTARRHYPGKSVLLIRKEKLVSIPCGIPYVFSTVGDPNKNLIPVENMLSSNNVDCAVGEISNVNKGSRLLTTTDGEEITYDNFDASWILSKPQNSRSSREYVRNTIRRLSVWMLNMRWIMRERTNALTGIINNKMCDEFMKNNIFAKEKCRDCWAKLFCSGGCHANAYFSNGNISQPNELICILQKKRIECAIMVQALMANK